MFNFFKIKYQNYISNKKYWEYKELNDKRVYINNRTFLRDEKAEREHRERQEQGDELSLLLFNRTAPYGSKMLSYYENREYENKLDTDAEAYSKIID
jgi:hypothetical protein